MSKGSICRWGILGTATIARKNWKSIWCAENATLAAVASRSESRAAEYISECQLHDSFSPQPAAIGSYEAMLDSDSIDAVYIPLPTGIRKEWVIRAARAGKHVLAEKPAADIVNDVEEMLQVCRENGVQYMDGVMFMHSQRLGELQRTLDEGKEIGPIRRINSQFSFRAPEDFIEANIRVHSELESLGCLGDLGWYNIRLLLCLLNGQLPSRVRGRILAEHGREGSPTSVPVEFAADLDFDNGVTASFYCSFLTGHQQWAHISGTEGSILLRDFVLPFYGAEVSFDISKSVFDRVGCDFNMQDHTRRVALNEYSNSAPSAQEVNMIRKFSEIVNTGSLEPCWPEMTLKTQRVVNACLTSARQDGVSVEL